jgi:hypothetical protein
LKKPFTKIGLVKWLKVKALSSSSSTANIYIYIFFFQQHDKLLIASKLCVYIHGEGRREGGRERERERERKEKREGK